MNRKTLARALLAFLLIGAGKAAAEDWNNALAVPRFQVVSPLIAKSIEFRISPDSVSASYSLQNDGENPLLLKLLFNTPLYSWLGLDENSPNRGYSGLSVKVNGDKIHCERKTEAFLDGQNVTEILAARDIDPNIVENPRRFPADTPEHRAEYAELLEAGLFSSGHTPYSVFFPGWSVKNTCSWVQEFPIGVEQFIEYTFTPLWGSAVFEQNSPGLHLLNPGFHWGDVESRLGGEESVQQATYLAGWLTLPLDGNAWEGRIDKIALEVNVPDKAGQPHLIFLTYGDITTTGLRQARFTLEKPNGADEVVIVILRRLT